MQNFGARRENLEKFQGLNFLYSIFYTVSYYTTAPYESTLLVIVFCLKLVSVVGMAYHVGEPGRSVAKKGLYRAGQYQNPLGGS